MDRRELAEGVMGVRLDMVAAYTVVHFATFGVLGALISLVVHEVEIVLFMTHRPAPWARMKETLHLG
jgi:hypothetical protein